MIQFVTIAVFLAVFAAPNCRGSAPVAEVSPKENASSSHSAPSKSAVDQLIPWLLDEKQALRGIAFSQVIFDTTGKRVLPVDSKSDLHAKSDQTDQRRADRGRQAAEYAGKPRP